MLQNAVIVDLLLHLGFVSGLFIRSRPQNFKDNIRALHVPVLSKIDLGVGTLIDLLFDFKALVNHDSLAPGRAWVHRYCLLMSYDLLGIDCWDLLNLFFLRLLLFRRILLLLSHLLGQYFALMNRG